MTSFEHMKSIMETGIRPGGTSRRSTYFQVYAPWGGAMRWQRARRRMYSRENIGKTMKNQKSHLML